MEVERWRNRVAWCEVSCLRLLRGGRCFGVSPVGEGEVEVCSRGASCEMLERWMLFFGERMQTGLEEGEEPK